MAVKRRRPASDLAPRNTPRQARSRHVVLTILEAAIRVLERDGAAKFTTIRVAERAGVSVGSLYQYFPNKESILLRLQQDEWQTTGAMLDAILADPRLTPEARVRKVFRVFFRSEFDEAPLRRALQDAAAVYAESSGQSGKRRETLALLARLVGELQPKMTQPARARAASLFLLLMSALGEQVSTRESSQRGVDAWARTVAEMFLVYVRAGGRA